MSEAIISWCWELIKAVEHTKAAVILSALVLAITWWKLSRRNSIQEKGLPLPGPWGLPLVGNLPFLHPDLHHCFAQLSLKHGPVMKLQLGSRLCVVISSPEAAKQVLQDHDADFADRDTTATALISSYGELDMAFAPHGDHWRMLRKVCTKELLSHGSLEALYGLRRREVRDMVSKIYSKIGSSVDVGEHVLVSMFSIVTSMMWGNTLNGEERVRVTSQARQALQRIADLLGELNISDLFPWLARFDLQGKAGRMKEAVKWFDEILDFVIDERNKMRSRDQKANADFLQVLLQLIDQGEDGTPFTKTHLKALFVDIILAGTKTTSTTVEWAMAELINQPEMMKRAQNELDQVVGCNDVVEEIHLAQLPYLDAIVKEIMRLHPGGPLLIPRRPRVSHVIGGYLVPKGSKILVNAWAIHRDPKNWTDPSEFQPERFFNSPMDWNYKGNDFRYIPFGSGRRICVGMPLAVKSVSYLLATLLHSFDWELPQGTKMDLSEKFGAELRKKIPLVAIPSPRLSDIRLY